MLVYEYTMIHYWQKSFYTYKNYIFKSAAVPNEDVLQV